MLSARHSRLRVAALAFSVPGITCGCGSGVTASPAATQVVAQVNGRELTISQLNFALAALRGPDSGPVAQQRALSALIDEELMVQAAQKAKIDRDPDVVRNIEALSREILVRTYTERHIFAAVPIEDTEMHKFYDANPDLFSARKIYHAVVFTVEQGPPAQELLAEVHQARSGDALRAILSRHKISFQTEEVTRAAEAIPLPLLPKLAAAGDGDIVMAASESGGTQLFLLTTLEDSPVRFDQVSSEIREFLTVQRNLAALKVYLEQLRAASKIESAKADAPAPTALK